MKMSKSFFFKSYFVLMLNYHQQCLNNVAVSIGHKGQKDYLSCKILVILNCAVFTVKKKNDHYTREQWLLPVMLLESLISNVFYKLSC